MCVVCARECACVGVRFFVCVRVCVFVCVWVFVCVRVFVCVPTRFLGVACTYGLDLAAIGRGGVADCLCTAANTVPVSLLPLLIHLPFVCPAVLAPSLSSALDFQRV